VRLAWAVALAATIASIVGILILTSDQALSAASFQAGVEQARKLDHTTDTALAAGLELPAANDALRDSLPHVVQTTTSLIKARTTLGTLSDQLVTLASVLDSADPPLDSVVTATRDTNTAAAHAQQPVDHIAATLDRANTNARDLGPKLDESLTRARTIESKLRVLLLLPIGTR
jgi:ABC-type transporter Mla subunit MlaD